MEMFAPAHRKTARFHKRAIITHRVNIETSNKKQTPLSLGQSLT